MLQALIFDFDGLILETEMPEYQSWLEVYQRRGVDLPQKLWAQVIGSSFEEMGFDPYDYLAEQTGQPVDKETIRAARRPRHRELVAQQSIQPGVEALIAEAQEAGLKLAVGSSSPHAWVDAHLKRLGLFEHFDTVVCRDDVAHIKPAPDIYLMVLERLNLPAEAAVVFEDSSNGIRAANRAGIMTVAVPTELTTPITADADYQVTSLAELSLGQLQSMREGYDADSS